MKVHIIVAWSLEDLSIYVLTEADYDALPEGDSVGPVSKVARAVFRTVWEFHKWALEHGVEIVGEDQMVAY